jgi:hypothetical protein
VRQDVLISITLRHETGPVAPVPAMNKSPKSRDYPTIDVPAGTPGAEFSVARATEPLPGFEPRVSVPDGGGQTKRLFEPVDGLSVPALHTPDVAEPGLRVPFEPATADGHRHLKGLLEIFDRGVVPAPQPVRVGQAGERDRGSSIRQAGHSPVRSFAPAEGGGVY